jgi:transposase
VGTIVDTDGIKRASRKGCLNHPIELKRQLAALACEPNISVAKLALKHGLNANLLFRWRRQYRSGDFGASAAEQPATTEPGHAAALELLPVLNSALMCKSKVRAAPDERVIEIVLSDVTVRLRGDVNSLALSTVLDCLARRR